MKEKCKFIFVIFVVKSWNERYIMNGVVLVM